MKMLKIFVLLSLLIATTVDGFSSYNLCENGDIQAINGTLYLNSSSNGKSGENTVCERIIYTFEGKLMLTLATSIEHKNGFQVIDGAFGDKKINSTSTKDGKVVYESTGNSMKIIFRAENRLLDGNTKSFQGTFTTLPFRATCECGVVQNTISSCTESYSVRKCKVQCQKDFVDLFNSTGIFTCNLVKGEWDKKYNNSVGCVQKPLLPNVFLHVNFTSSGPDACKAIKNKTFNAFFDYLLSQKAIKENGVCLQSDFSQCFEYLCNNKENNSFISVNIQDKPLSDGWNSTYTNKALFNAYNKSLINITEALISSLNDSSLVNDSIMYKLSVNCPKGTFEMGSKFTCSKCPSGAFYKLSSRTCERCSGSSSSSDCLKNSTQISNCGVKCMEGKELDKNGFCQWCQKDAFKNNSASKCTLCPDGMKTLYRGSTSTKDCFKPCEKGTFFNVMSKKCEMCPMGTYQNGTNHLHRWCIQCEHGKITLRKGSESISRCIPHCKEGHFINNQTNNCTTCPAGSYQNSTNKMMCLKCPKGLSTLSTGSRFSSQCQKMCLEGHYFNATFMTCLNCSIGSYMDKRNHMEKDCFKCGSNKTTYDVGATQCLPICAKGHYFNLSLSTCVKCAIGSYQNTTKQTECDRCPDGKTTITDGSVSLTACIKPCPKGTFYNAQNSSCIKCPFGAYMNMKDHFQAECIKCKGKLTTYIQGAFNSSQCFAVCKVGQYFSSKLTTCKECAQGFYQMKQGQISCEQCSPGLNTSGPGATSKLECIKTTVLCTQGEFYNAKKQVCQLCDNGTYQSAVNHNLTACQSCQSGRTKSKGTKDIKDCLLNCKSFPCKNGAECSDTDSACRCPNGILGRYCEVIEKEDTLQKIQASVRFTSLNWSENLGNSSSREFREVSYKIEKAFRDGIYKDDDAFVGVKVTKLTSGSVIAEFEMYTNSKNTTTLTPAKSLQDAVAKGTIGGLTVDPESLKIKQTCSQLIDQGSGNGKLESGVWAFKASNDNEKLEVQFDKSFKITAIETQGDGNQSFVKSYQLMYSIDGKSFVSVLSADNSSYLKGNNDSTSTVKNILIEPITSSKFIRVIPKLHQGSLYLRAKLYGCLSDPILSTPSPSTTTEKPREPGTVVTNPNVKGITGKKDEYAWGQYLGITFAVIMVIVIIISCFMWWRSSQKKSRKDDTPLVLTRFQDGSYREIEREDEEAV